MSDGLIYDLQDTCKHESERGIADREDIESAFRIGKSGSIVNLQPPDKEIVEARVYMRNYIIYLKIYVYIS